MINERPSFKVCIDDFRRTMFLSHDQFKFKIISDLFCFKGGGVPLTLSSIGRNYMFDEWLKIFDKHLPYQISGEFLMGNAEECYVFSMFFLVFTLLIHAFLFRLQMSFSCVLFCLHMLFFLCGHLFSNTCPLLVIHTWVMTWLIFLMTCIVPMTRILRWLILRLILHYDF